MKDKGIAKKRTPFGSIRAMSSATESWRQLVQCRVGGRADIPISCSVWYFTCFLSQTSSLAGFLIHSQYLYVAPTDVMALLTLAASPSLLVFSLIL